MKVFYISDKKYKFNSELKFKSFVFAVFLLRKPLNVFVILYIRL